jgi:7-cyano-7-deazaguanine synthase
MSKAVILLSGGLDSVTTLFHAKELGYDLHAISFNYGQRHVFELKCAEYQAQKAGARHIVAELDSRLFRGTALVGTTIDVPENRQIDDSIPVTYVPARNMLFLAHALSLAESIEAFHIFIGANALDYSGYPDCRPAFLNAFETAANLGTKAGVEGHHLHIVAPLLQMTKAEIVKEAFRLNVELGMTSSCYNPDEKGHPCGKCDSCMLREKGFAQAGYEDPARTI